MRSRTTFGPSHPWSGHVLRFSPSTFYGEPRLRSIILNSAEKLIAS